MRRLAVFVVGITAAVGPLFLANDGGHVIAQDHGYISRTARACTNPPAPDVTVPPATRSPASSWPAVSFGAGRPIPT
jgi:hypothetical protein